MVFIYFHDQGWVFFTIITFWYQIMKSDKLKKPHPAIDLWQIPPDPNTNVQTIKDVAQRGACRSVAKACPALLPPPRLQPARLLCPWDFSGKNTGVGCYFLLQGIFLTQGLNPCLLHWQEAFLPLSHQGSPSLSNTNSNALSFNF